MLDLSHNLLKGSTGLIIGKILSAHCKRRDDIIWSQGEKNEPIEEDISLKGICEVNLSYNKIDDSCIKELA